MKDKISTGTNDRPKSETIGQTGSGLPDDSGAIIEVTDEQVNAVREKLGLVEPSEDTNSSEEASALEDTSPARRKDQARSPAPAQTSADAPGAEEIAGAGAEEDTYD